MKWFKAVDQAGAYQISQTKEMKGDADSTLEHMETIRRPKTNNWYNTDNTKTKTKTCTPEFKKKHTFVSRTTHIPLPFLFIQKITSTKKTHSYLFFFGKRLEGVFLGQDKIVSGTCVNAKKGPL